MITIEVLGRTTTSKFESKTAGIGWAGKIMSLIDLTKCQNSLFASEGSGVYDSFVTFSETPTEQGQPATLAIEPPSYDHSPQLRSFV